LPTENYCPLSAGTRVSPLQNRVLCITQQEPGGYKRFLKIGIIFFKFLLPVAYFLSIPTILYVWPELTNQFFKTPKVPQNEVRDGKIIENEGGLHLGV
jgi:hypothetical protein